VIPILLEEAAVKGFIMAIMAVVGQTVAATLQMTSDQFVKCARREAIRLIVAGTDLMKQMFLKTHRCCSDRNRR
jgi:hypothetical protein